MFTALMKCDLMSQNSRMGNTEKYVLNAFKRWQESHLNKLPCLIYPWTNQSILWNGPASLSFLLQMKTLQRIFPWLICSRNVFIWPFSSVLDRSLQVSDKGSFVNDVKLIWHKIDLPLPLCWRLFLGDFLGLNF